MASLWKRIDRYFCQFLWNGKRKNVPLGEVSEDDARDTAATVGSLIDRIKRDEVAVPAASRSACRGGRTVEWVAQGVFVPGRVAFT
jgi:hypothetical protein